MTSLSVKMRVESGIRVREDTSAWRCSAWKTRIQRSRTEWASEKHGTLYSSIIHTIIIYWLWNFATPYRRWSLAIVSRDKLRRLRFGDIQDFRIINHHNAISVNSIRYCWNVCYIKFNINHDKFQFMTTRGYRHAKSTLFRKKYRYTIRSQRND